MRLLALTAASVAVFAFTIPQIPQLLAQGPDMPSGASVNQDNTDQARSSGGSSTKSNARWQSHSGSYKRSGSAAGTDKSQAKMRISAKSRKATVRGRSSIRVGVSSESREKVMMRHKRAHGVARLNEEAGRDIVIKHKRPHRVAALGYEPRRHIVIHRIHRRHPGVAVTTGETTRTTVRSRMGSDVKVRTGMRSRETTGSATMIHRGQSSSSKGPSGSQSGKPARGSAGNKSGGSSSTTTGQGSYR